jgi:hypothetical protein
MEREEVNEAGRDESPPDAHEPEPDEAELSERFEKLLEKVTDRDVKWAVRSVLKRAARATESDKRYRLRLRAEEKLRAEAEARADAERGRAMEVQARLAQVEQEGGDTAALARAEVRSRVWRAIATSGDVLKGKEDEAAAYLESIDNLALSPGGEVVDEGGDRVTVEDFRAALELRPELLRPLVGPGSGGRPPNALRGAELDIVAAGARSQSYYDKHKAEIERELRRRGGSR